MNEKIIKIYHINTGKNCNNFGDLLGPYFYKKIYGHNYHYDIPSNDNSNDVYFLSGSINEHMNKNVTSFGCGVCTEYDKVFIKKPKKIISVRGPLTYKQLILNGIECPKIYGDTGLLLPKVYNPQNITKKYVIGYIPHYSDYDLFIQKYKHLVSQSDDIIIDICSNVEEIINLVLQCKYIVSSSLHGCIVAHAYNITVLSIKLSEILNDFKFRDHYYSIGLHDYTERIDFTNICNNITREMVLNYIYKVYNPTYPLICDIDFLWDLFPLNNNKLTNIGFLTENYVHDILTDKKYFTDSSWENNENKKINIGFLTDKYVHYTLMDRDFYHMYLSFRNNNKFNSFYIGQGIDKWPLDWSTPLDKMIKKLYDDENFFDIIVSLPGGGPLTSQFNLKKTLRLIHFHETFDEIPIKILTEKDHDIIFFKSPKEMTYYLNKYPNIFNNKIVKSFPQIPYTKHFDFDYHHNYYGNNVKNIDVLISGNLTQNIYPLRHRLFEIIKKSDLKYTRYPFKGNTRETVEDIIHGNKNLYIQEEQERDYQDHMLKSKITICTASKYGYLLKKYIEAILAKCLVIGNIPDDYYDIMKSVVIDVSDKSDEEIIDIIKYWLKETNEREKFVNNAYEIIIKNFSSEILINKYYEGYLEYKSIYGP